MLTALRNNIKAILIAVVLSTAVGFYVNWKNSIYEEVEREVTIEQQQNYIDTRKRIDEATATTRSPDAARERLLERQLRRQESK